VLQLTVLWFSFFTLLCGLAQDGTQLLVFRALMGFGFGGEWVAGAVLMGEMVARAVPWPRRRHGAVRLGGRLGTGRTAVRAQRTAVRARRWPGVCSSASARFRPCWVLYVRRYMQEPPFASHAGCRTGGTHPVPRDLRPPPQLRVTVLCALVGVGAQGGYYAVTTWLPQFLAAERGAGDPGSRAARSHWSSWGRSGGYLFGGVVE